VAITEKNLKVVQPESLHFSILHNQAYQPISTSSFNEAFRKYLRKYEIATDNPSSHTLRKTFALRLFEVEGGDARALAIVQKALSHRSTEYTAEYIGVTWKAIKSGLEKM
jgi:integrase